MSEIVLLHQLVSFQNVFTVNFAVDAGANANWYKSERFSYKNYSKY